ncbi:hypothetical protein WR25_11092 [Diploscapter pachys]|uniref:Cation-transporting ATPase n=1 Tax=Diploscapter pachys TaxID=2018661 RepID=A0A2A2L7M5_9BILA|nr:hypothetical protein WR25_11092 [Diploscapter pachys]
MAVDALIEKIRTHRLRPIWAHLYVAPFISIYAIWLFIWTNFYGFEEYYELGLIGIAIIFILQALVVLFCQWFVRIKCLATCTEERDLSKATHAEVVPTTNNGWPELVPLHFSKHANQTKNWFEFQRVHYTWNEDKKIFETKIFDTHQPFRFFQKAIGFDNEDNLREAKHKYGDNTTEMVVPQFMELFLERATAPFFVFQVFCVGLWCLEDMWYYSLFTLFMLMTFEATLVKAQMKNMSEIRNMGNKSYLVNVYRGKKWTKVKTEELVAGDIVSVGRSTEEQAVPCDLLLLRGHCIVDESMLTGESVPQMKESVEDLEKDRYFDIDSDSRLHVIFGGTKIVQHTAPSKGEGLRSADGGVICYVLRTGFNTSQGRLLRTIMFGVKRVTANNLETFCFILFLLIFAIAAAGYLWVVGSQDEKRSKYKLFLECTLILTSVIPPELPIELSLAVNSSLIALQKLGIFCTEPFRIPFAGKIDICCFDKTGTLTTDNLVVEGVAVSSDEETGMINSAAEASPEAIQVLASCHSLVRFEEDLVGDPLEKACLSWCDWTLTKADAVMPPKHLKTNGLKIFQRYHFSSALKRMTVIAGYQTNPSQDPTMIVTVKGAPETLRSMYANLPSDYDETYIRLTRQGARVLAMGIKQLEATRISDIRDKKREDLEKDLKFVGFVVISCPLKPDTKVMIKEIVESSHKVVMITGDNPLTACHVAQVLRFIKKRLPTLVLDDPATDGHSLWRWKAVDESVSYELVPFQNRRELETFFTTNEFCVTGAGFAHLLENESKFLRQVLPHIRVYARMAPKQKERVINELKSIGKVTLMCGDGTNDVGALKHANVGVALLSHPYDATKMEEKEKERKAKIDEARKLVAQGASLPGRRPEAPHNARAKAISPAAAAAQSKLEKMMKELEEEDRAQVVKLGDASIAAPFTSKYTSIASICHVIKQGRCTLVTTLQMFKILALNALVSAYSLSVLYMDGVKFSDTQATIQGLLLAACFLFISRSKPLKTLSRQRPMPNIFNAYPLLTVSFQFIVHFSILLYVVGEAHRLSPRDSPVDLEAKFSPNILNTTVYIISMALQVCTFAVNYRGRPFMESLLENKAMLYSVAFSAAGVFVLATGSFDDLNTQLELVKLPDELQQKVLYFVMGDLFGCYLIDRSLNYLLGDAR